jgi:hypothetical protein
MAKGRALAIPVPGPGRKSLYNEAYAEQAFKLCLLGATDEELADFFGVDPRSIYRWQNEHPAFCQAIIDGKVKADAEVAHSLYKTATGHQITAEKVVKNGDRFEAVRYKQFIPGDPNAAYRWLLNRRRRNWTDNKTVTIENPSTVEEARAAARAEVHAIFGTVPEIIIEPIHGQ